MRGVAGLLRDRSAILSILVRNQAGEVLKAAIQAGDLSAAEHSLTAEWGFESLYGGRVRRFTPSGVRAMLNAESLELIAERGIRYSRITCRLAFLAARNTSRFWRWNGSLVAVRSMQPLPLHAVRRASCGERSVKNLASESSTQLSRASRTELRLD